MLPYHLEVPRDTCCCVCGGVVDRDFAGFAISCVSGGEIGPKSGVFVPEIDGYPDGTDKKYVCFHCLPNELLDALWGMT